MHANDVLSELSVSSVINCVGTRSQFGGLPLSGEVLSAMASVSATAVELSELNRATGRYIATVTGAEAGMVTSGAASGIVLSVAACMTGASRAAALRLPDTNGMRNEVVMHRIHRGHYSHMYTYAGARIVEVGNMIQTSSDELAAAIGASTAAVAYLVGPHISTTGLTLPETVAVAHGRGVPVIVDAAAMIPPRDNLKRYVSEGADLVIFSGGKVIGGPQNSGLLFGRADLIEAAMVNASPGYGIGRPHKITKEAIVGLYVALKRYVSADEATLMVEMERRCAQVAAALGTSRHFNAAVVCDGLHYHVPTVVIYLGGAIDATVPGAIAGRLLDGIPRIAVLTSRSPPAVAINPLGLRDSEIEVVVSRLRSVLDRDVIGAL